MALDLDTLGLSATIDAEGISAPAYQTILSTLTGYFQQIYGTDAYLDPDSKDGQMIALMALAINDANNTAIQCYNSFSPSTAQSDALSRNVKINGISRQAAVNSTADLTITGTGGTVISNGSVKDANGVIWNLPTTTTILTTGTVTVTATCAQSGAVSAVAGSITKINTPTLGWVSVTNAAEATVGSAAETDAELRSRQTQSVALPSLTPFDALDGAIGSVDGVTRHKLYENDTETTDDNGLPAHSVAAIVDGGDVDDLAEAIRSTKGQGVTTYGSTSVTTYDKYGNPHIINLSRSTDVPIAVTVTLLAFTGYNTVIGTQIKQAIADYINDLGIGNSLYLGRLYSAANLTVGTDSSNGTYFDVMSLEVGRDSSVAAGNVTIAYNESASCSVDDITLTVTS
ncbi:baseplate J/gp47 family protein [Tatumella sp. JGM130]|uniref:baseplate J/gp47 family protein n=1 Tax=Tatumella sp. JGM130 TaxID=2799797 RepID=UPI001BAF50E4|nr:baseplate J/gp47 family protein [Tatumella sp. JGM130]MBS0893946.1 baseplate J/gp47 family protein [Tatumella sp. JGM130]